MMHKYKKGADAAMDAAFASGAPYGKIKVADELLFARKGICWRAIRRADIAQAYRRVQEVRGRTCCCTNDFSIHHLIVLLQDGSKEELLIGEGLYRHEPERLLEEMQRRWPEVAYGLPVAEQKN